MAFSFDIESLYQKAFNINIKPTDFDVKPDNAGIIYPKNQSSQTAEVEAQNTSKYGSSSYFAQDKTGRYYFMPVKLGGLELPYPIIRIQNRKNIIETQLTERRGSAIEIVSQDNYKIYIRGFIIDHDRKFPEDTICDLVKLWERNESLVLSSVLTDLFLTHQSDEGLETDKVVITDINFPEVQGIEHVKPYEINLISDSIFNLTID